MTDRHIEAFEFDWQGRTLSVTFEPDWLNMSRGDRSYHTAHIEVRCITPDRGRLPITETGYRSHFCDPDMVASAGGVEAYIREWLDEAAESPAWKAAEEAARQPSLFDAL